MTTTTNPFKRFQQLLGSSSKQIATVVETYADGMSLVTVRGRRFTVRGTDVEVGKNAWVVDGEVISEAPKLPVYSIVI